jgi:primosomal protein N' (replication factor Y)
VRVLADVSALDKEFDYEVPESMLDQVQLGTLVRIELQGRRVGGWVVALDVDPPEGVALKPLAKVTGHGPGEDLIGLAEWAAVRWAGRRDRFLGTASPPGAVRVLPPARRPEHPVPQVLDRTLQEAFARVGPTVLRWPPGADVVPLVQAAAGLGNALVVCPSIEQARHVGRALGRVGVPAASYPRDWAQGRAGATVVGARAAAWAPVADLAVVLVLDEHDEALQEERAPTWHARDVAVERARRAGVPCVLASPCPSLDALALVAREGSEAGRSGLVLPARTQERAGWPIVDVVDRRDEDPGRTGLFSEKLVHWLKSDRSVVCVLNRTGRARLLACTSCGVVAACERCQSAVVQTPEGVLRCLACGLERPVICQACGSTRLKTLRMGVTRAREELEALAGEPVVEVTATTDEVPARARVYVGTEAVLHRVPSAGVVAFLDLDQELLAPRFRAAEQALALVVRGARLLGGREGSGRLLLQTRLPEHGVVQAALRADPGRLADAELEKRQLLGLPPATALAQVSGAGAAELLATLLPDAPAEVLEGDEGRYLVRAADHEALSAALAGLTRSKARVRIEVDPLRA